MLTYFEDQHNVQRKFIIFVFIVIIEIVILFPLYLLNLPKLNETLKRSIPVLVSNRMNQTNNTFNDTVVKLETVDISAEDKKLFKFLQEAALNSNNRYYLTDFEYFSIVREKFPHSSSSAKIGYNASPAPVFPSQLTANDVLFLIMGSARQVPKATLQVATWLQWSKGNFFIFADAANDTIPFTTLPEILNKSSYNDAQHRQLIGSQWLIKSNSQLLNRTKWFIFNDDDTWINIPALISYLQLFDHNMPLAIGYIWHNTWITDWSYFSGGAAIVVSQPAFMLMVPHFYTDVCPFSGYNDLTLMNCMKQKGITKIHSDKFSYEHLHLHAAGHPLLANDYVGKISFHYMNNPLVVKRITCVAAAFWKAPINDCENVHRNDSNHLNFQQEDAPRLKN